MLTEAPEALVILGFVVVIVIGVGVTRLGVDDELTVTLAGGTGGNGKLIAPL
jgi:hypothetical protein